MRKIVLDFSFDRHTGDARIVVDYEDPELSAFELSEAIRSGQIRDEIIALAGTMFGEDIATRMRDGKIPLICTDHHPEVLEQPRPQTESAPQASPNTRRQAQDQ